MEREISSREPFLVTRSYFTLSVSTYKYSDNVSLLTTSVYTID